MKSIVIFLVILFNTYLYSSTLILDNDNHRYHGFYINYLFTTDKVNIKEIIKKDFNKTIKSNFSLGHKKNTLWIKLKIKNNSKTDDFILTINESFYEKANIYYKQNNHWLKKENSLFKDIEKREVFFNKISFPLTLKDNNERIIYLELKGKYSYFGNIELYKSQVFQKKQFFNSNTFYIIVISLSTLVFIFSFFSYISLKKRLYLFYTLYTFFNVIYLIKISGLLVYINLQDFIYLLYISVPLFLTFLSLFSFEYLEIKKYFPKKYRYFYIFPLIFFLLSFPILFAYNPWNQIINIMTFIFIVFMLFFSLYLYIIGENRGKYYFIAIFIYFISALFFMSMLLGVVEYNIFTRYCLPIGISLENIIFILLIVLNYKELKEKNEKKLIKKVENRTKDLKNMAEEKQLLLKELYHRVKNNFHIINAMLWYESKKNPNISFLMNRVHSMSLVNELLYQENNLNNINIKDYLTKIIYNITKTYDNININTNFNINQKLSIKNSINLAMILSEVLTNSIKHNKIENLKVEVSLKNLSNSIFLYVEDNGQGFDTNTQKKGGLGLSMIKDFAKKLEDSKYNFEFNKGTKFSLEFKENSV